MNIFHRFWVHFLHNFENVKVFAFVGSSGSGKSYSAEILKKKYNIDLLIDDGLLIKDNKVLGGFSAKQEKNEMMAVKRAIFMNYDHRHSITRIIDMEHYPRVLVLGTSLKMIGRITENLHLPPPSKVIYIEDIRSKEDIEYSHRIRNTQGKHIIPLPYIELKKYIDTQKGEVFINDAFLNEKTIVSPKFSLSTVLNYSAEELKIIIESLLRDLNDSIRVKMVYTDPKSGVKNIDVSIYNVLNSRTTYDFAALKAYLNDKLPLRVDDAHVSSVRLIERIES